MHCFAENIKKQFRYDSTFKFLPQYPVFHHPMLIFKQWLIIKKEDAFSDIFSNLYFKKIYKE